ncbi:hypothetical protein K438DRAFT_1812735 [Mycena galopus ATCC 62051]|nr:hypothetical protein K438DRAFT_1812735 [Mycena galopus ATCC 62051]
MKQSKNKAIAGNSKRKRNVPSDPTSDDATGPATQPKKKAKTIALESTPVKRPMKKKKTVRFNSTDMPPSSSPTLHASSPPPSDGATVIDDTLPSSPLSKFTNGRARAPKAVAENRSAKENRAPQKLAPQKTTKAPKKGEIQAEEETVQVVKEELLLCDQGNHLTPTGFTCVLCASTLGGDDDDATNGTISLTEPKEGFDWHFGFSSFPGPPGDYTGLSIDMTPLSAIPFLTAPAAFLAAAAEPAHDVDGLPTYDDDGCVELDGQKFSYDGIAIDEQGVPLREFFPIYPTGPYEWKEGLLMDSEGNWLSEGSDEDAEGEVDEDAVQVDVDVDVVGSGDTDLEESEKEEEADPLDAPPPTLRLPSFSFD